MDLWLTLAPPKPQDPKFIAHFQKVILDVIYSKKYLRSFVVRENGTAGDSPHWHVVYTHAKRAKRSIRDTLVRRFKKYAPQFKHPTKGYSKSIVLEHCYNPANLICSYTSKEDRYKVLEDRGWDHEELKKQKYEKQPYAKKVTIFTLKWDVQQYLQRTDIDWTGENIGKVLWEMDKSGKYNCAAIVTNPRKLRQLRAFYGEGFIDEHEVFNLN